MAESEGRKGEVAVTMDLVQLDAPTPLPDEYHMWREPEHGSSSMKGDSW